jgi:hypothetical protein
VRFAGPKRAGQVETHAQGRERWTFEVDRHGGRRLRGIVRVERG